MNETVASHIRINARGGRGTGVQVLEEYIMESDVFSHQLIDHTFKKTGRGSEVRVCGV